jgi:hypothetical protein
VFATADPRAEKATFAGRGELRGLAFEELADLVAARAGVTPDRGVLHMQVRFRAAEGRIAGSVRPMVEGAGTRHASPDLLARLRSMIADDALDVFGARVSGRDPEATTIPIHGTVEDPGARSFPMVIGVLRSAFVQGLTAALEGPPPPAERERAREQARRGLSDGRARERRATSRRRGLPFRTGSPCAAALAACSSSSPPSRWCWWRRGSRSIRSRRGARGAPSTSCPGCAAASPTSR